MTYKEIVNEVLLLLREDQLGGSDSIDDEEYWKLIGRFVNDAKREVEDSWNWTDHRSTLTLTTTASQNELVLTNSTDRAKILGIYDTSNDTELRPFSHADYNRMTLLATQQTAPPLWYRRRGVDSNGDLRLELYPQPDAAYNISAYVKIPQATLSADDTTLTLANATQAIIWRAYAMAIAERGEDEGQGFMEAMQMYQRFLADAIAFDAQDTKGELDWYVE